jgi:hypothetical protein
MTPSGSPIVPSMLQFINLKCFLSYIHNYLCESRCVTVQNRDGKLIVFCKHTALSIRTHVVVFIYSVTFKTLLIFCVQKREAKNKKGKLPKKASQYDDELTQTNSSRGRHREIETETNGTHRFSSRGIAEGNRWDKTADSEGERSPEQRRRSSSYSNAGSRRHPDADIYDRRDYDDVEENYRDDGRYHPLHKVASSPGYSLAGNGRTTDVEHRTPRPHGGGAAMPPLSPLEPLENGTYCIVDRVYTYIVINNTRLAGVV